MSLQKANEDYSVFFTEGSRLLVFQATRNKYQRAGYLNTSMGDEMGSDYSCLQFFFMCIILRSQGPIGLICYFFHNVSGVFLDCESFWDKGRFIYLLMYALYAVL